MVFCFFCAGSCAARLLKYGNCRVSYNLTPVLFLLCVIVVGAVPQYSCCYRIHKLIPDTADNATFFNQYRVANPLFFLGYGTVVAFGMVSITTSMLLLRLIRFSGVFSRLTMVMLSSISFIMVR